MERFMGDLGGKNMEFIIAIIGALATIIAAFLKYTPDAKDDPLKNKKMQVVKTFVILLIGSGLTLFAVLGVEKFQEFQNLTKQVEINKTNVDVVKAQLTSPDFISTLSNKLRSQEKSVGERIVIKQGDTGWLREGSWTLNQFNPSTACDGKGNDYREFVVVINYDSDKEFSFVGSPYVLVSLTGVDGEDIKIRPDSSSAPPPPTSQGVLNRWIIEVTQKTQQNFTVKIRTWCVTKIHNLHLSWIAIGY